MLEFEINELLKKATQEEDAFFTWELDSYLIAEHLPHLVTNKNFNWKNASWAVAKYCPQKFKLTGLPPIQLELVLRYYPEILIKHPELSTRSYKKIKQESNKELRIQETLTKKRVLINKKPFLWEAFSKEIVTYAPSLVIPRKLKWNSYGMSEIIVKNSPKLVQSKYFNWNTGSYLVYKHCPQMLNVKKANLSVIKEALFCNYLNGPFTVDRIEKTGLSLLKLHKVTIEELKNKAIINKV